MKASRTISLSAYAALRTRSSWTTLAVKYAEEILQFYNRYYGVPYPFGKLDIVAAPDFDAGAMENTAAIFYREAALLVDEKNSSQNSKAEVFGVLAHEMAHQWFGDLVTMKWWDNLWLNESFRHLDVVEACAIAASRVDSPRWSQLAETNARTVSRCVEKHASRFVCMRKLRKKSGHCLTASLMEKARRCCACWRPMSRRRRFAAE